MNRLARGVHGGLVFCLLTAAGAAQDIPPEKGTAGSGAKAESVLFEALPVVEAASLHAQTLLEAPASVTVITDEEIRVRGYRTLADVLADVRGMYVTYDRAYHYVGVRGFSLPGDSNDRFLVMINSHSLTDNVYGLANFGADFGLDLDLIKRIEIVRGPSSALYGTSGMFATINIVTKSPVEYQPLRVSAELDSFGEHKAQVSGSQYLGHGANLLISGSIFNSSGQSPLFFPAFDTPQTNHGLAVNMDGERGYHAFANLIWNNWSFTAYFNNREKAVPTAWFGTVFDDGGDQVFGGRDFVEASYQRSIGLEGQLRWRVYYDEDRFQARLDFASPLGIADGRNVAKGDWMGTELTYRFRVPIIGFLTVGTQANWDLRAQIEALNVSPFYLLLANVNHPDRSLAVFFQDEWKFLRRWTLYLGGRADGSRNHALELTPRVALIYQPSETSAVKLLYGRSFRNPTPFEQFYGEGFSQIPNPGLGPERMETLEAAIEKHLNKRFELQANIYHYRISDLIQAVRIKGTLQQYQNTNPVAANGLEMEALAKLGSGFKLTGSLSVEKVSATLGDVVNVNSPARVGKLLLDSPVWRQRWSLSGGLQYLSERLTLNGSNISPVYLANFTAAGRLPGDMELAFGIRNVFNYRYWDPAGRVQEMESIQQDGRSCFVRVTWAPERKADTAPGRGATNRPRNEP
jgi:iron complex outermembrane receptor protein